MQLTLATGLLSGNRVRFLGVSCVVVHTMSERAEISGRQHEDTACRSSDESVEKLAYKTYTKCVE